MATAFSLPSLARVATTIPFRLLVAIAIVAYHVVTVAHFTRDRYGLDFNSAPGEPPAYVDPAHDRDPLRAQRLIVSRWDAGHYLNIAIRGYSNCPYKKLTQEDLVLLHPQCDLSFFPGYALLGRAVSFVTRAPIDYALWFVSLLASTVFLFLWTDPFVVRSLGVGGTYAALISYNAFPASCNLVFMMTEPALLCFVMASFVALSRGRFAIAALLAGAATGIRVTGVVAPAAVGVALVVVLIRSKAPFKRWLLASLLAPVSAWGFLAMAGYDWWRFGDPILYFHSQAATHQVLAGPTAGRETELLMRSIDRFTHDGVWLVLLLLLTFLGYRAAMKRLQPAQQAFLVTVTAASFAMAGAASFKFGFEGLTRYSLAAFLPFFVMGHLFKRRWLAFALWIVIGSWHYREVDVCTYMAHAGGMVWPGRCNQPQWGH